MEVFDPYQLIPFLQESGLFRLWVNFTSSNQLDLYYTENDFAVTEIPQEGGGVLLMLTFPKPEDTPLCSRAYL